MQIAHIFTKINLHVPNHKNLNPHQARLIHKPISLFVIDIPQQKFHHHQNLWKFLYLSSYVSHLQFFIKQLVIQKKNANLVFIIELH